jgi:glutamate-ammonia-ligase adenylyltransferase
MRFSTSKIRSLLKSHSPYGFRQLEAHPADLTWILEDEHLDKARTARSLSSQWRSLGWENLEWDESFKALREVKRREMLRITLRDLSNEVSLEETVSELSLLADFCLQRGLESVVRHQDASGKRPSARFSIFGLGKLGGQELNYSSDIDLIFVYSEEGNLGKLAYHDYFKRTAELLMKGFRGTDDDPVLFRIDLRLRPEGNAGPIVRSLEGYENYYAAFGEAWERMALQKARLVAGDPELGYEFIQHLQPFCFPKLLRATGRR